jgi:hypothetical protein
LITYAGDSSLVIVKTIKSLAILLEGQPSSKRLNAIANVGKLVQRVSEGASNGKKVQE